MAIVTCPACGTKNRVDEVRASGDQPVCGRCKAPLPAPSAGAAGESSAHPLELTDDTFDETLRSAGDVPVLVDCWAAWCPPCRALAPTIDALAAEADGRWLIAKLDTDANPRTSSKFRIEGIPTILIFRRGQLVDQIVGLAPKQAILAKLQSHAS